VVPAPLKNFGKGTHTNASNAYKMNVFSPVRKN